MKTASSPALAAGTGQKLDAVGAGLRNPITNFLLLMPGQGLGQAIAFVVLVVVARAVGPSTFGGYQFAFSALTYFSLFANLGIVTLGVRDVTANLEQGRSVAGEVAEIRVILASLSFVALLVLSPHITPTHQAAVMLDILGVTLIFDALAGDWFLQAHQRLGVVSLTAVIRQLAVAAFTVLVLTRNFEGLERYGYALVLGTAITSAITAFYAIRLGGAPVPTASVSTLFRRWRRSLPFAWSFVMIQIYYTSDSLFLGYLKGTRAVGQYGAAYRFPLIVIGVISLWTTAVYPYLTRRAVAGKAALSRDVSRATGVAIVLAVALTALIIPIGRAFMIELFGVAFAPAAPAFIILMATASVVMVSVTLMNALLAAGDERRYATAVTAGAVANTVLNVALIPSFGATGAAVATLLAELIVCLYMLRRVRAVTGPLGLDRRRIGRGVAAALLAGCALAITPSVIPAVADLCLGAALFGGLALWLRVFTLSDVKALTRLRKPV